VVHHSNKSIDFKANPRNGSQIRKEIAKLVVVHLRDWSESDGIVKEISLIERCTGVKVRDFKN
jgi:hypothetical protein